MTAEFVPLGKLITVIRNGLNTAQYDEPIDDGMLPISRIETISEGVIDFERVKYARVSEAERRKYQLRSGDILFSHINSPAHIGKTAIFRSDQVLIHGVNLLLLRLDLERCYPEYLNYYLKSFEVRAWFRARCKKAVNQASLNQSDIKLVEAPLPPLPEQKRIAAILVKADRLRRLRRTALDLSDTYLQSVFLEMFGDPVSNPMGWEMKKLGTLGEIQGGLQLSRKRDTLELKAPYLRVANVYRDELDLSEIKMVGLTPDEFERVKLQKGDLLIVEGHGNINEIGRSALWDGSIENCVHQNHLIRMRVLPEFAHSIYLSRYINSSGGRDYFKRASHTTSGLNTISTGTVRSCPVPLPPLPLQQEFAHIVHQFERLRAQQRETQRQAEHLFQTLLHRAFRGEL
jgi:type I restriction enzyme S subunit